MAEYILKKPGDHVHLSFEALIFGDNAYWSYEFYPFYAGMVHCHWVKSEIVRMVLKSGIIDTLVSHIHVLRLKGNESSNGVDYNLYPRSLIKAMNVLTQLLISPFRNQVLDILTPLSSNETFPRTPLFYLNIETVQTAMKRPDMGLWENNDHVLPFRDRSLSPVMPTEGKSILMFVFRSHWISRYH